MYRVMILGAGRIGRCIANILHSQGTYEITLADQQPGALNQLETPGISTRVLDVHDEAALQKALTDQQVVISACSFAENPGIARAALTAGISYFDLTEDVATTRTVRELSAQAKAGQVFVPQCGLAPGFIGILGADMGRRFDSLHELKLRVGALPEFPSNPMMYNLTWSTDGLINEYCNPCEAIKNGRYVELQPLEGLENFSLDGVNYEAFNTSGGLGTLCETLKGQVQDLTYKTIRYPGHQYLMDFLINGLRLGEPGERRDLLKRLFETAVAVTLQDVVVVFVTATGKIDGQLMQLSEHHKIYHGHAFDRGWSGIQISTAASICVVVDMFLHGQLPQQGFVKQEDISLQHFMQNPMARPYRESAHRRNEHAGRSHH